MTSLLSTDERPAYETFNEEGSAPLLITCDHASHRIPRSLGDLGLSVKESHSHIGWDIGALEVSKFLSEKLDAPLVATKYSRLVIDCNRQPLAAGSVPALIHGIEVPGNRNLTPTELASRVTELFEPYHRAVEALLQDHLARKGRLALLAMHSYTPVLGEHVRPWPIGITFETPSLFSEFLLTQLRTSSLGPIGVNEPYPITPEGDYGIYAHGKDRGIDAVLMEIRQDLLEDDQGKRLISETLAMVLESFFRNELPCCS